MKAFRSNCPGKYRLFWIRVTLFTFTIMLLSSGGYAGDLIQNKSTNQTDEQIQIVADKLITNSAEKFAEFVGDVRASQGNLVINSERLRIYYRDDPDRNNNQIGGQESIKQIILSPAAMCRCHLKNTRPKPTSLNTIRIRRFLFSPAKIRP